MHYDLRVMAFLITIAWKQLLASGFVSFHLYPTSGSIYSDALRAFSLKAVDKTYTLFTEYFNCCFWHKELPSRDTIYTHSRGNCPL